MLGVVYVTDDEYNVTEKVSNLTRVAVFVLFYVSLPPVLDSLASDTVSGGISLSKFLLP